MIVDVTISRRSFVFGQSHVFGSVACVESTSLLLTPQPTRRNLLPLKFAQNHRPKMKKDHFRLTCVAQKRLMSSNPRRIIEDKQSLCAEGGSHEVRSSRHWYSHDDYNNNRNNNHTPLSHFP